jgi:hypothetical protein
MDILIWSIRFSLAHLPVIGGLSLLAAVGRAVQMGLVGPISPQLAWLLELLVEGSRIAVLLYVISRGSLRRGAHVEQQTATAVPARHRGRELGLGLLLFSAVALVVNAGAGYVSHHPSVLATLRGAGLGLRGEALGEAVRFFIKNLTIIPFTIIFMVRLFSVLADSARPRSEPEGEAVERPSSPDETDRVASSAMIPEPS